MKFIKINLHLATAIFAIFILILCISSASAIDDDNLNSTLTVDDQNIVESDDILNMEEISFNNGEELLESENEEILKSDNSIEIKDKSTGDKGVIKVDVGTTITIQTSAPYDSAFYYMHKSVKSDFSEKTTVGSYMELRSAWEDKYSETFTEEGTYYYRVYNSQDRYGIYSNVLTYVVGNSGGGDIPIVDEPTQQIKLREKDSGNYSTVHIAPGTTVTLQANVPYDYYNLQVSADDFETYQTQGGTMQLSNTWTNIGTIPFPNEGTYYLRLYNIYDRYGKYSNVLTFIVENPSDNDATASISIKDNNYPENSTIFFTETYTADLYYTLTKSGEISGESFEVFLDDKSVGTYSDSINGKLKEVIIDTTKNHNLYVVYKANNGNIIKKSNIINYVYVDSQTMPATVNITIKDNNYPTNSTIYFNGENYSIDLYYTLTKTGTLTDESVEVYLDSNLKGTYTLSSDKIITLQINNSTTHTVYVIYKAFENDESFTKQSNTLTFIPQSATSPEKSDAKIEIRDRGSKKTQTVEITSEGNYTISIEYYLVKSENDYGSNEIIGYVNGIRQTGYYKGDNIAEKSFDAFSTLTINKSGIYTIKLEYKYMSGIGQYDNILSNEITYIVTINNSTQKDHDNKKTPSLSSNVNVDGKTATINVLIDNDATKNITVTLNTMDFKTEIINQGATSHIFQNLKPGFYNYTVTYEGDDNYKSATTKGNFTIKEDTIAEPLKIPTYIEISSTSIIEGNEVKISLADDKGNVLSNQILTLIVNGESQNKALINGFITVYNLKVGNNTIYIAFKGDDEYNESSLNTTIVVKSLVNNDELSNIYDKEGFKLTFYDENGNPLKNTEVKFTINGNDYLVNTTEDGVASLKLQLAAGNYVVYITHPITNKVFSTTVDIIYKLKASNVNVDYSYSKYYKVYVYDKNNNPVAGEYVTITLNKVKYSILTNKKGIATLKIKGLLPKTYSITSEYMGVKVSNKVVVKQILKAKNVKFKKYKKVKKYKVTLKTSKGNAIKGKKITLKVKGKTYKAKTNKKGVATFKIKNLKKVGKFKATIKYLKTSIKKTITVKR